MRLHKNTWLSHVASFAMIFPIVLTVSACSKDKKADPSSGQAQTQKPADRNEKKPNPPAKATYRVSLIDSTGALYLLDEKGQEVKSFTHPVGIKRAKISNELLAYQSTGNNVYVLDRNGRERSKSAGVQGIDSQIVKTHMMNNHIVFLTADHNFYFSQAAGGNLWGSKTNPDLAGLIADVKVSSNCLVARTTDSQIYIFDIPPAVPGNLLWNSASHGAAVHPAAGRIVDIKVLGNKVAFLTSTHDLYLIESGVAVGGGAAPAAGTGIWDSAAVPAVAGQIAGFDLSRTRFVYWTTGGSLYLADIANGAPVWSTPAVLAAGVVAAAPAHPADGQIIAAQLTPLDRAHHNRVVFRTRNQDAYLIDADNGAAVWNSAVHPIAGTIVDAKVSNARLLLRTANKNAHIFGLNGPVAAGAVAPWATVGRTYAGKVIGAEVSNQRVVFHTDDQNIYIDHLTGLNPQNVVTSSPTAGQIMEAQMEPGGNKIAIRTGSNLYVAKTDGTPIWDSSAHPSLNHVIGFEVTDQRFLVHTLDRNVYAFDHAGNPVWNSKGHAAKDHILDVRASRSLMALRTDDNNGYVVDASGSAVWNTVAHGTLAKKVQDIQVSNHRIGLRTLDQNATILDAAGNEKWNSRSQGYAGRVEKIKISNQMALVQASDRNVYLLNQDGSSLWDTSTHAAAGHVAEGQLSDQYMTFLADVPPGAPGKNLYVVNPQGIEIWKSKGKSEFDSQVIDAQISDQFFAAQAVKGAASNLFSFDFSGVLIWDSSSHAPTAGKLTHFSVTASGLLE